MSDFIKNNMFSVGSTYISNWVRAPIMYGHDSCTFRGPSVLHCGKVNNLNRNAGYGLRKS